MKFQFFLVLGLSALAVGLGLSGAWLPAPKGSDAAPGEFSAERAWQHVFAMARKPHPAGTEENQRVRAYLLAEMSRLGLQPRELPGKQDGLAQVNLYGELGGSEGKPPAILLVSHYDSVPTGPGAADCASGVATLLETLRALRAGPSPRNSIGLLLTDGEERGMKGARAFIRDHPELWRDVRVLLNLEARGNHGPVVMFETSPGAAGLIRLFSRQVAYPVAASYSREVYRRLPNNTDFTCFMKAGCVGMNFSFIGGIEYYHSPQDTPENLSRRTLQHYGSLLLPLTVALAKASPAELAALRDGGETTYFSLWRGCLARYPEPVAKGLAWATPVLFIAALWQQRRRLRLGRILGSFLVALINLGLATGLGFLALWLLRRAYHLHPRGIFVLGLPHDTAYLALLTLAAAALTMGLNAWWLKRLRPGERLAGVLMLWLPMTLLAAWYVPGAGYLFLWPTLLGIVGLWLAADVTGRVRALLVAALTSMPAPCLLAGTLYIMHQAVTIGMAPVSMGLVALAYSLVSAPGLRRVKEEEPAEPPPPPPQDCIKLGLCRRA